MTVKGGNSIVKKRHFRNRSIIGVNVILAGSMTFLYRFKIDLVVYDNFTPGET